MEEEVTILKSIECDSLSRKSTLTYQFGLRGGAEIVMRISGNSGKGMFCPDWVSVSDILNILREQANQELISSLAFRPLYMGRSSNTPGFLMAALRHEEVIAVHPTQMMGYQAVAVSAFEERINALLRAAPEVEAAEKPQSKTATGKVNKKKVPSSE